MTPEFCSECDGHGVKATAFAPGHRIVGPCCCCGGRGVVTPEPVPIRYAVTAAREAACRRKRVYRTRAKAARALARFRQLDVNVTRPYKCPVCGYWHLTKQRRWDPPWERREEESLGNLELPDVDG